MLLSGALFALFMMGFWLYCLTDAVLTPGPECRGLPKPAWIAVIAVTFIGGAIAWLIVRSPVRGSSAGPVRPAPEPARLADGPVWLPEGPVWLTDGPVWPADEQVPPLDPDRSDDDDFPGERWTDADDAVARHPAGRARGTGTGRTTTKGPDDDPDFLRALDRAIRGNFQPGEEV
jgi:hypothetical protein